MKQTTQQATLNEVKLLDFIKKQDPGTLSNQLLNLLLAAGRAFSDPDYKNTDHDTPMWDNMNLLRYHLEQIARE